MGYICSSNSDLKLFHHDSCRYTKIVSEKNAVRLRTSGEARDQGYQYCKYCSSLMKMIQKEAAEINAFEKTHGIYLSFDRTDGTVDVISSVGRWKLVYNHKHGKAFLYHRNTSGASRAENEVIKGYHYQSAYSETILGYLKYIDEHDSFRSEHPLYSNKKRTYKYVGGTKKRHKKEKNIRRAQRAEYVDFLLKGMSSGALAL